MERRAQKRYNDQPTVYWNQLSELNRSSIAKYYKLQDDSGGIGLPEKTINEIRNEIYNDFVALAKKF